jgi:hypothetical protein
MKGKTIRHDKVSHLLAAMHDIRAPGHSQLYLWMRQNHDRIAEGFNELRPSWLALATRLGEMDIRDGSGKAPTPQIARATWYRVRRDLAAARARHAKTGGVRASLLPGEIAPGVLSMPPPTASLFKGERGPGEADTAPPSRPKLDIRPARPRGEAAAPLPIVPSTTPPETATAPPTEPAEAQLRRVLDAMATSTTPMPRIVPPGQKP